VWGGLVGRACCGSLFGGGWLLGFCTIVAHGEGHQRPASTDTPPPTSPHNLFLFLLFFLSSPSKGRRESLRRVGLPSPGIVKVCFLWTHQRDGRHGNRTARRDGANGSDELGGSDRPITRREIERVPWSPLAPPPRSSETRAPRRPVRADANVTMCWANSPVSRCQLVSRTSVQCTSRETLRLSD